MSGTMEPELVLDARAGLGEGPSWDAASERLLWVDIFACEVHRFDPATGRDEVFPVERPVGAAVPRAGGGIVVCRQGGIAALDPATGGLEELVAIEADRPKMMLNDAAGRLFAGTLDVDETPEQGSLYRIDADLGLTRILDRVTCSNGIGWSPDGGTMYYVDSALRRVDVLDYDPGTGSPSNRRGFLRLEGVPQPDGLCVDVEGHVWVAFWDGWCVRRYRPDGAVDREVPLPVERVTSCCFGGPELADLYITTASPDEPDPRQPQAGGLFRLRPGVRGQPTYAFAG